MSVGRRETFSAEAQLTWTVESCKTIHKIDEQPTLVECVEIAVAGAVILSENNFEG